MITSEASMGTLVEESKRNQSPEEMVKTEQAEKGQIAGPSNVEELRKELCAQRSLGGAEALMGIRAAERTSPQMELPQPSHTQDEAGRTDVTYRMRALRDADGNQVYSTQKNERGEEIRIPVSTLDREENGRLIEQTPTTGSPALRSQGTVRTPLVETDNSSLDLVEEKDAKGRLQRLSIEGKIKW